MIEKYISTKLNQKKVIKYTSIGVLGLSLANVIVVNSSKVDKFIFSDIKGYLLQSEFNLLLTPIPNWFVIFILISAGVLIYYGVFHKYFGSVKNK